MPGLFAQQAGAGYLDGDDSLQNTQASGYSSTQNQYEYADNQNTNTDNDEDSGDPDPDDNDGNGNSVPVQMNKSEISDFINNAIGQVRSDYANDEDQTENTITSKWEAQIEAQLKSYILPLAEQQGSIATQAIKQVSDGKSSTSGLLRNINMNSAEPRSCRSASTGKKSKKNKKGCEAVLPINLNYGCWCHADSTDIFKGKGQHMDEFDKACKMYKQCLRCVRHDSRSNGEVCDPGTQKYFTENSRTKDGVLAECSAMNENNCAINTCCCEVEYIRTVLKLFMIDGIKLDRTKYHSSNKFNYENQCTTNAGPGPTECCGVYPHRRMYNTASRECCENKSVFDPVTHVCCDDGTTGRSEAECNDPNREKKRRRREIMMNAGVGVKAYMRQQ